MEFGKGEKDGGQELEQNLSTERPSSASRSRTRHADRNDGVASGAPGADTPHEKKTEAIEATPERLEAWRTEAKKLTEELKILEQALVTEDRAVLEAYGGAETAGRIWREKSTESDRLGYNILKREIVETRRAEGIDDDAAIEESIALAEAELAEAHGLRQALFAQNEDDDPKADVRTAIELDRRIKGGESLGEIAEDTHERIKEAERRLEELRRIEDKQSMMESMAEEWRRLTAERRREFQIQDEIRKKIEAAKP